MRKLIVILTFMTCFAAPELQAQRLEVPITDADRLASDWLTRLNALEQWYLSPDGQEVGLTPLIDRMMELYAPDVLAELPSHVPYDPEQIGPVQLKGSDQLRKWFEKMARAHVRLDWTLPRQTAKAYEGVELVYTAKLPWGGLGASFPVIAVYSAREDRKRYMAYGVVILQTREEDGKIQRLRLYLMEVNEVVPI
jgi:hypothetical protein